MLPLIAHSVVRAPAVRVEGEAAREGARLRLAFAVEGDIGGLALPPVAAPVFVEGLWKHTCFEAFVAAGEGEVYIELNLSPSGAWAAWRFSGYREGMTPLKDLAGPRMVCRRSADRIALEAEIDLASAALPTGAWKVGLTAVLEEKDGRLSYFAIAHPRERPDFHDARGFILELA